MDQVSKQISIQTYFPNSIRSCQSHFVKELQPQLRPKVLYKKACIWNKYSNVNHQFKLTLSPDFFFWILSRIGRSTTLLYNLI